MKTSEILLQSESSIEETPGKVGASMLSKSLIGIFILSSLIFMSSCFIPVGHEGGGHGGRHGGGHGGGHGWHHERHG